MARHFVLVWTILSKLPGYNWLYNVIWPSKPGYRHLICGDICNIGQTMIQNIIFGNGGLPISDNFAKGTPSRFFAKMFIFVLVPRKLIMSGVRPDSILSPFWKSSHRLYLLPLTGFYNFSMLLLLLYQGITRVNY